MKKSPASVLKFHGVRGSRPYHVTDLLGYGGNSTCLEINAVELQHAIGMYKFCRPPYLTCFVTHILYYTII